jgi:hypothetical protein
MKIQFYPERFGRPPDPWWKRNPLWRLIEDQIIDRWTEYRWRRLFRKRPPRR